MIIHNTTANTAHNEQTGLSDYIQNNDHNGDFATSNFDDWAGANQSLASNVEYNGLVVIADQDVIDWWASAFLRDTEINSLAAECYNLINDSDLEHAQREDLRDQVNDACYGDSCDFEANQIEAIDKLECILESLQLAD